jgi:hypothetical protein
MKYIFWRKFEKLYIQLKNICTPPFSQGSIFFLEATEGVTVSLLLTEVSLPYSSEQNL